MESSTVSQAGPPDPPAARRREEVDRLWSVSRCSLSLLQFFFIIPPREKVPKEEQCLTAPEASQIKDSDRILVTTVCLDNLEELVVGDPVTHSASM
jgi:hypothetical protein